MKNDTKMWIFIITTALLCALALLYVLMYESERESDREFWDFASRTTDTREALRELIAQGVPSPSAPAETESDETTQRDTSDLQTGNSSQEQATSTAQDEEDSEEETSTNTAPVPDPVVYYRADGTYYRASNGQVTKLSQAVGYWDYLDEPTEEIPIPHGELLRYPLISPAQDMVAYCITTIPSAGGCFWRVYDLDTQNEYEVNVTGGGTQEAYSSSELVGVTWEGGLLVAEYTAGSVEYSVQSSGSQEPWQMTIIQN